MPSSPAYVGQTLHYWPLQCEKTHDHSQPFRADVCHVHDDGRVNLLIHNEIGIASRRLDVPVFDRPAARSGEASPITFDTPGAAPC